MAYDNGYTAVTGATFTAAQYNTYDRDNRTAMWVGTTAGDTEYYTGATAKARIAKGAAGEKYVSDGSKPVWIDDDFALEVAFITTPSVLTAATKQCIQVPVDCVVEAWEIVAPIESGSIVVDVWKDTYSNFPPTVADTIAGSEKPTITSSQKGTDTSLGSFSTSLSKGDWLIFNIDSCTSITHVVISLKCRKVATS